MLTFCWYIKRPTDSHFFFFFLPSSIYFDLEPHTRCAGVSLQLNKVSW